MKEIFNNENSKNEIKKTFLKIILLSLLICGGILVAYDIIYYLASFVFLTMNPYMTDSKLDALSTLVILISCLFFIYVLHPKILSFKDNKSGFKILTFRKFRFKNYVIATIFVVSMMAISNIWLFSYEYVTGDTKTMEEVSQALVSDLDSFEDENKEESTESIESSDEKDASNVAQEDEEGEDASKEVPEDSYLIAYLWVFASVVLFGAITEEVLMRGICFKLLEKYSTPFWAIFLSALTFGIFHGNVPQGGYTFLMGLFLAILYYGTKDFLVVCFAHLLNNFLFTLPKIPESIEETLLHTLTFSGYILIPIAIFLAYKLYKNGCEIE